MDYNLNEIFHIDLKDSLLKAYEFAPDIDLSEWSDNNIILPKSLNKESGRYRSNRFPFLKQIMLDLSVKSDVQEVCFMKPTQIGATQLANNLIGYRIDIAPTPTMLVMPTLDLARDHSKNRIQTMIDDTPVLRSKVAKSKAKDSENTILSKKFAGGILYIVGSNSGAFFRNRSVCVLIIDDFDGHDIQTDAEGSTVSRAIARTDAWGRRKKIYYNSTPTLEGYSNIEKIWNDSNKSKYQIQCPFCNGFQELDSDIILDREFGFKYLVNDVNDIISTWYECKFCKKHITENYKTQFLSNGVWIPEIKNKKRTGYNLSSLYSPIGFFSWEQYAKEFHEAKQDLSKMQVFWNNRRGLPYKESGEQPNEHELIKRCENYLPLVCPEKVLILTAGVDVHDNRLDVVVRGWGKGEESWLIYWGSIDGDPEQSFVWEQLSQIIKRPYKHEKNIEFHILSCGIDSGGHRTQFVYRFCKDNAPITFALKGSSTGGKPIIGKPRKVALNMHGKTYHNAIDLYSIDTKNAKSTIYSRLKIKEDGNGKYHWYQSVNNEYFLQLTAEKLITRFYQGFPRSEFKNVRHNGANHALDCEVYALAAAYRIGLNSIDHEKLEQKVFGGCIIEKREKQKARIIKDKSNKW